MNDVLTPEEKWAIKLLNDPLYTVDFIEEWLSREPANIFSNAPAALQQMGVNGFMSAVRRLSQEAVLHAIHRSVDEEYRFSDIKDRLAELDDDQLCGRTADELMEDEQFLSDVMYRWEKSLDWCDTSHDVYWETCDYAIEEVLKGGVNI